MPFQGPMYPSRRQLLARAALGFGWVASRGLLQAECRQSLNVHTAQPHFAPRAKSIIFLYQDGGPSQVDTFDPKPALDRWHGKPFPTKIQPTQFNNIGNTLKSPWKFHRYGESGLPVSELFPKVARHADKLCVVRSMKSQFSEHTNANYLLHTGLGLSGRPSVGAWLQYGLGSINENLPGFIVLNGGLVPPGGLDCFGSGFLPAAHQGSLFRPSHLPLANIKPLEGDLQDQREKLDLIAAMDQSFVSDGHDHDAIKSAIRNQELAFQMQAAVPELVSLDGESEETKELYGLNHSYQPKRTYGMQCLLARRMVERGVRFIELTCPAVGGADRWDQHQGLKKSHGNNAQATDQGIAALLEDLERRGLLDETLVVWAGEFGRTPFAQGRDGRDHNPFGFTIWLAGGGIKGGTTYGETDEFGYHAVSRPVEIYDLHATMLHLMGLDHERLTVRHSGRDMRLTDVHGHVINPWFQ